MMDETTTALLIALGIDVEALQHLLSFHADRHEGAYLRGTHGQGVPGPFGRAIHAADYESPNCPDGWDTLLGFLAREEPYVLAMMDQCPEAAEDDERALDALCAARGVEVTIVRASSWLAREGVFEARAYPIAVLRTHAGMSNE